MKRGSKSNSSAVDTTGLTVMHFFMHASTHRPHCTHSAHENSRKLPPSGVPSAFGLGLMSLFFSAPVGQNTAHMPHVLHFEMSRLTLPNRRVCE